MRSEAPGPKTERGKAKSSRNSLRHGLSIANDKDSEIRAVAQGGLAETPELLRARLEMACIHPARSTLLAAFLKDPNPKLTKTLRGIDRYESKALAKAETAVARGRQVYVNALKALFAIARIMRVDEAAGVHGRSRGAVRFAQAFVGAGDSPSTWLGVTRR